MPKNLIILRLKCVFFFALLMADHVYAQLQDTLIDAGSSTLHFKIWKGQGMPILFESGGGLDASQWDSIGAVLHNQLQTTVITYDRAGFGLSPLDATNHAILQEINNLESALVSLGYHDRDIVLVGHSLGSFYNRVFASRHPELVKGIVLLDPRIPSEADMAFARSYFLTLDRKDFEAGYMSLYYLLRDMEAYSDYVRQQPMPDVPVLNIMAETGPFNDAAENERFQTAQREFVKDGKSRKLVVAKGSSHNIPLDRPEFVIEWIGKFYRDLPD